MSQAGMAANSCSTWKESQKQSFVVANQGDSEEMFFHNGVFKSNHDEQSFTIMSAVSDDSITLPWVIPW